MRFNDLRLHDALIGAIHISWESERCDIRFNLVGGGCQWLVFEGFTKLDFPRAEPWGASQSVNTVQEKAPGVFEIELQSGDVLHIVAPHWSYRSE
ncbi:MAG: hypothetical protein Q7T36_15840 [Fluviicoccus sp.]|uniref:hypothetical protein n=1 Tax=Fluviicoccus sp. TaxID=2003552 RepID=UPI00271F33D7|nr:hypothetical protein [Fluviicoccus sp.]MDO8331937.1 hypothetical protein [Fluviicoccus sp.]